MTALQQVFNDLIELHPQFFNLTQEGKNFVHHFHKYLEVEREQIVKAYDKGEFNCGVNETAEQYYVKTYK
jgi:hypothetical protein